MGQSGRQRSGDTESEQLVRDAPNEGNATSGDIERLDSLDILINNAGLAFYDEKEVPNNVEFTVRELPVARQIPD
jgi:hypothetical protein